jgi:hypothetical protein
LENRRIPRRGHAYSHDQGRPMPRTTLAGDITGNEGPIKAAK